MTTYDSQYAIETTWSTRNTEAIIIESIKGDVPLPMELKFVNTINELNKGKVETKEIFVKIFSIILKEKVNKPIQSIATQIGHFAGIFDAAEAFEWGILLLKECESAGLYNLTRIEEEWYVCPNFALDKKTRQKLDKLQFLPPMKVKPLDWTNNTDGGWLQETKHIVLGTKFTKHSKPLAYDVINKLQSIQWTIDPETYLNEKDTNRNLNKKKFLRVLHEYIGDPFHFVWRYDSRGRSYSSGYDLNIQSNEYGKALISLHNKEQITNLDNLKVAIANHAGKDKLTWEERIQWVEGMDGQDIKWDEPMLGRKALRALKDTLDGKPSGYVMSIDATSSGLQIMAVLSGCQETARLTNCVDPKKRYDAYHEVAKLMNSKLTNPVAKKIIKQAAMTHFYNSKATPKALLGEHELEVFYDVLAGLFPGAEEVMEIINSCWNYEADHHTWTLPDGHTVYVPVVEGVDCIYADPDMGEIPLRYYTQTNSENFRSLCPNVIHSIDAYVAREMIRRCDFQLAHIHDCFLFSPDHLQDVADTYREIMAEIADSDLLQDIVRQITGDKSITLSKYSNVLSQCILSSSYMLS